MQQLIPPHVIASADKVLFITHFAIGDFVYWQNYLQAFAQQYPHLKIDVWVDEVRRSRLFWRWNALKKYSLYDWLESCPWVHTLYRETYSPGRLRASIKKAQQERYPLVVSLATLRSHEYAQLGRTISPKGFVVGMATLTKPFQFVQKACYKKLTASLKIEDLVFQVRQEQEELGGDGYHISDLYAKKFRCLFGLTLEPHQRVPFVDIPRKWQSFALLRFLKWGIDKRSKEFGCVIFINSFAKSHKRSWPLERVLELVTVLKQQDAWKDDVSFVVNVMPNELARVRAFFDQHSVKDLFIFSADYNFFQLPAVIRICDLVISVETSVMHLASALKVPVVALMRTKNPEWRPWDRERSVVVCAEKRHEWVKDIPVERVLEGVQALVKGSV